MGDDFRPFFKKGKRTLSRINATAPLNKGAKGRNEIKDYNLVSLTKGRWCEAPEGLCIS